MSRLTYLSILANEKHYEKTRETVQILISGETGIAIASFPPGAPFQKPSGLKLKCQAFPA